MIHSYTYVVPISPVPKYSGGLSLRKNCLERFKSTPLIVYGTCAAGCEVQFASVHLCTVSLWGEGGQSMVVCGDTSSKFRKFSACPRRAVRSVATLAFRCFALWSIKIWEVYSSRRPIHSRASSVQVCFCFIFFKRPREVVREATGSGLQ